MSYVAPSIDDDSRQYRVGIEIEIYTCGGGRGAENSEIRMHKPNALFRAFLACFCAHSEHSHNYEAMRNAISSPPPGSRSFCQKPSSSSSSNSN